MFEKNNQAIEMLKMLSKSKSQSIVISGMSGSGKTYCAKLYHKYMKTDDFALVDPKMQDIRDLLENIQTSSTVCIENIDCGVQGVSQAVLKFVETPPTGIYIIVTCRKLDSIPETILSRCAKVELPPVSQSDLVEYTKQKYPANYEQIHRKQDIWKSITNIHDIDWLCTLTERQLDEISGLYQIATGASAVSSIVWKLQNLSDSTKINTEFVLKYLMQNSKNPRYQDIFRRALDDMEMRIPAHAALSHAIMQVKYEVRT